MCRLHQSLRTDTGFLHVVKSVSLSHHVSLGDDGGKDLAVAALQIFLAKRSHGVEMRLQCRHHLEAVVDIQVGILFHGLSVNYFFTVVLVI